MTQYAGTGIDPARKNALALKSIKQWYRAYFLLAYDFIRPCVIEAYRYFWVEFSDQINILFHCIDSVGFVSPGVK